MKIKKTILFCIFVLLFGLWFLWGCDFYAPGDAAPPRALIFSKDGWFCDSEYPLRSEQLYCWVVFLAAVVWALMFVISLIGKNKLLNKLFAGCTGVFTLIFAAKMLLSLSFELYGEMFIDIARFSYYPALIILILFTVTEIKNLEFTKS